jgi:hypothetical protein
MFPVSTILIFDFGIVLTVWLIIESLSSSTSYIQCIHMCIVVYRYDSFKRLICDGVYSPFLKLRIYYQIVSASKYSYIL